MAYEWRQDFEDGNTRATCSKCGVPYRWPDEIKKLDDGFYYCLRTCLEETIKSRDKRIAQSRRRRELPPPKFVIAPQYADDYLNDESKIFGFVLRAAPADTIGGSSTPAVAAFAAIYLADICIENRRPVRWTDAARAKLIACVEYLLSTQYGAAEGPSPSTAQSDIRYGGVFSSTSAFASSTQAFAGIAFVRAYRVTGDPRYLAAADRVAYFLRAAQCMDTVTSGAHVVYPSGGPAYHTGGIVTSIDASGVPLITTHTIQVAGQTVAFIDELATQRGYSATYGVASSSFFSASTQATLQTMRDECSSFITVGAKDSTVGGAYVVPFSTTTPRDSYSPYLSSGSGTGQWTSGVGTLLQFMFPIWAFTKAGTNADLVAQIVSWTLTFTSNPANRAADGATTSLIGTNKGTFDPAYSMCTGMDVVNMQESTGTSYDWRWLAYTAQFQSTNHADNFTRAKNALSEPQPSSVLPPPQYRYIGPIGRSGLSFQPRVADSATFAAIMGNVYRYAPASFGDRYSNPGD